MPKKSEKIKLEKSNLILNKDSTSNFYWYVIQVFSQCENRVRTAMIESIKISGLKTNFNQILVPTEEVIEMKSGQKRKSQRKFFPGYILIEMEMNDKSWHLVRHVPHVLGFVGGTHEKPIPISQKEIEKILNRMKEGKNKPKPKTLFEVGEMIRVIDGPFTDFSGVIEEVNYEKNRIKVSVMIFGRSTPVELEFKQVEKEII